MTFLNPSYKKNSSFLFFLTHLLPYFLYSLTEEYLRIPETEFIIFFLLFKKKKRSKKAKQLARSSRW